MSENRRATLRLLIERPAGLPLAQLVKGPLGGVTRPMAYVAVTQMEQAGWVIRDSSRLGCRGGTQMLWIQINWANPRIGELVADLQQEGNPR